MWARQTGNYDVVNGINNTLTVSGTGPAAAVAYNSALNPAATSEPASLKITGVLAGAVFGAAVL
jgi:hypothetical protein